LKPEAAGLPAWPFLAVLMAAGLGLRLINLDSSLWYDEIVTLVKYVRLPPGELLTTCTEFNNHMLFSLLAQGSIAIFGESAWALRLPAVLFGIAAIPALWWLASLLVGRREAFLAALLLTVSCPHVAYSQSARAYTGLLFFSILSTGLFLRGLRTPGRAIWVKYAVVNAAALFTHLTFLFALAAHGLVWLFTALRARPRRDLRPLGGLVASAAGGTLLYAPLLPQLFRSFGEHVGADSSFTKVLPWTSPLWTLQEIVGGLGSGPVAFAVFALVAVFASAGFVALVRRDAVAVAAMVLFAPIVLVVFWTFRFHIWPRYFFPLLGPGLIFLVHGVEVAARRFVPRAPALAATAAVFVLAAGSVISLVPAWHLPKVDFEGARDYVSATRGPGEPVLTAGMAALGYTWLYAPDWTEVKDVAQFDQAAGRASRAWFVHAFPTALRFTNPGLLERVQERFEVVREFPGTVKDGTVVVSRSR
jgi:mannosyltransferase